MAVEGDLAFIHVRYLNWGGKEHAGVDIFRFDSDAESWSTGTCCSLFLKPRPTPTRCFEIP